MTADPRSAAPRSRSISRPTIRSCSTWPRVVLATWAISLSLIGLLMTAIFLLMILDRVFFGPLNKRWSALPDLTTGERLALFPALALMFVLGLDPQLILGTVNQTVVQLVSHLRF